VAGTDPQPARPISSVGLRQGENTGPVLIDDLKVTVVISTQPVITAVSAPSGGMVQVDFLGTAYDLPAYFGVQRSGSVGGSPSFADVTSTPPIAALGGGKFRATVPALGEQSLYRIRRLPMTF